MDKVFWKEMADSELAIGILLKPGKIWLLLWEVPLIKLRLRSQAFNWTHIAGKRNVRNC